MLQWSRYKAGSFAMDAAQRAHMAAAVYFTEPRRGKVGAPPADATAAAAAAAAAPVAAAPAAAASADKPRRGKAGGGKNAAKARWMAEVHKDCCSCCFLK